MDVIFSAPNMILLLGAAQGLVLGFVLLKQSKRNKLANRLLAFILFFFSGSIAAHVLAHSFPIPFLTDYHPTIIALGLINLVPLFYLYVQSLTEPGFNFSRSKILHFVPFLICLLFILPISILTTSGATKDLVREIIFGFVFIIPPLYIVLTIITLRRFPQSLRQNFSSIEKIDLKWIQFLVFGLVFMWVGSALIHYFIKGINDGQVIWIFTSIVIYLMGYFGLAQPEIFKGLEPVEPLEKNSVQSKYQKSALTDTLSDSCYQKLKQVMRTKELFLMNDLTLPTLAGELKISTHHLSQVINEKRGQSFYDYINSQRIEKAQEHLQLPENILVSIATIGFNVGFNSLSAFNKAFKKFTGMTPSQYRSAYQKS